MSEQLLEFGGLTVTRFYGGIDRGVCYQLTDRNGYVQLTQAQFDFVRRVIEADLQHRALHSRG